ncbi:hypothetical protein [Burkholderia vietnamiensis]|uniref:hypothetical protein n=1 Tax=Burkholderia vietnamiensis TaxID=60552 RepID=UPI001CF11D31|nr:hypothetical protein [Burkholderia vietnamiensis]MCA8266447.1 hypothetical protein [Burkholderia vietnamiensis]
MNAYMNPALDAKGRTLRAPRRLVKEHRDGWLLRTGRSDGMTLGVVGFVEPDPVYALRLRILTDRAKARAQ